MPKPSQAIEFISEDKQEFIKNESTKWISSIRKYYGDNPLMQEDLEKYKRI